MDWTSFHLTTEKKLLDKFFFQWNRSLKFYKLILLSINIFDGLKFNNKETKLRLYFRNKMPSGNKYIFPGSRKKSEKYVR